ncbi:MAG: methyltransferase domain-containing protein [Chlorobiaceae bacterium]|nr:methyltransferase domain-containing protein [Chlorobiaceae bacterium]
MSGQSSYIISGGDVGASRLHILSRAMMPASMGILVRSGLAPGMAVLDLGCGSGDVTLEIAKTVGPEGRVVGIDMDEGVLMHARKGSEDAGCGVEWRCSKAEELKEEGAYDIVYARFLLSHLPDPAGILQKMKRALKPDGRLVVEDIDINTHAYWPFHPSFRRYIELYAEAGRLRGVDPGIGPSLAAMAVDAGFEKIEVSISMPVFISGEGKTIARITLLDIADAVIESGLSNREEIEGLIGELLEFERDPKSIQSTAQVFQITGQPGMRTED